MANILYRGSTPSSQNASSGGVNRPLSNDEIDKNFYALKTEVEGDNLLAVSIKGSSTTVALTLSGNNTLGADSNSIQTINGTLRTNSIKAIDNVGVNIYGGDVTSNSVPYTTISAGNRTTANAGSGTDEAGVLLLKGGDTSAGDGSFVIGGGVLFRGGDVTGYTAGDTFGGVVHIVGGTVTATGGGSKFGGDVRIDVSNIGANGTASYGVIRIGTGMAVRTGTIGVYATPSIVIGNTTNEGNKSNTSIGGNLYVNSYAYFPDGFKIGHTSDTFVRGSLTEDAYNDLALVCGGYYSGSGIVYTNNQIDMFPTRFVSGLGISTGGNAFKFQRGSTKNTGDISWVDLLTISTGGNLSAIGSIGAGSGGISTSGAISCTGDITSGGRIYAASDIISYYTSDASLKTNIIKIDNALSKVNSLDGITFNWNENAKDKDLNVREAGIIAQQVEKVLPEVVKTRDDGTLAVKYDQMIPLLLEAIKELSTKVEDLQNQLNNK